MTTICDKGAFFSAEVPDCLRAAVNEVRMSLDGKTIIRPVCGECTETFVHRRSRATIEVVPLAEGIIEWAGT